jgi:hypothetical protein
MNACEFYYISREGNLPIQAKGIERSWSDLQQEFGRSGPGYPGATYYKTISDRGPQLFAVVNNKWVLYHDDGRWHRYLTACDITHSIIEELVVKEDDSWIMVSEKRCDTQAAQHSNS